MSNGSPQYDIARMRSDLAAKGWLPTDLARRAGVSDMTVSRFLRREAQSARTAKKLAKALGYSVRRYFSHIEAIAAAAPASASSAQSDIGPAADDSQPILPFGRRKEDAVAR